MRAERLGGVGLAFLSGLLAAVSFPTDLLPGGVAPLAFVALVPLLARVRATRGERVGWPFYVFGVVSFTVGCSWLAPVLTPPGSFALSLLLSFLFVWPAGHLLGRLVRVGTPLVLAAPVVFLAAEWFRSWFVTGFPWLFLGYTQAGFAPLAQTADLAGVYGVSAIVVLVNAALVEALFRWREAGLRAAVRALLPAAVVLVLATGYGLVRPGTVEERPGPEVLLVQGNIPQYMKHESMGAARTAEEIQATHLTLTEVGVRARPDVQVVIWPETMFAWWVTAEPGKEWARREAAEGFREVAAAAGGRPSIVGAHFITASGEHRNSAFLVSGAGEPLLRYDKVHAVPGGEYIPLRTVAPEGLVRWVGKMIEAQAGYVPDLTEGDGLVTFDAAGTAFAPLICYEISYPALVRDAVEEGGQVILNLTNYGWFPETEQPEQGMRAALFRAIETRRPVVVSANTGISAVVSPRGEVRALSRGGRRTDVRGTLVAEVPRSGSRAPYMIWGDAPAMIAAALALLLALRPLFRRRERESG